MQTKTCTLTVPDLDLYR